MHALSVGVFQNAGGTPVMNDMAIKLAMVLFIPLFLAFLVKVILMRFMKFHSIKVNY